METNYCRETKSFKTEMKEKKVCKGIKNRILKKNDLKSVKIVYSTIKRRENQFVTEFHKI